MNAKRTPAAAVEGATTHEPRYPVRVVAERTGLTPAALRAWERRHGAVRPTRTKGAQRLYSDADIDRLRLIARLSAGGHSLAEVAARPLAALRRLAASSEADRESRPTPNSANPSPAVMALLEATKALDGAALRRVLSQAVLQSGPVAALETVISPFLRAVGDAWACGDTGVANEHLATAVVRDSLGAMLHASVPAANAPALVAGTFSGELHELGAMMAAVVGAASGWRVLYLGPNLPAHDFARAAKQVRPLVTCIGLTGSSDPRQTREQLSELRRKLGPKATIVVGGSGVDEHRLSLRRVGAKVVANREELHAMLTELGDSAA